MGAQRDSDMERDAQAVRDAWVAVDTAPAPAPEPAPAAPAAAPAAAPVPEVAPATVQTRRPDGTFGPKATTDAVPRGGTPISGGAAPATDAQGSGPRGTGTAGAVPAAGASAAEVQDFIEATLNDQPFKVPKGIRLPQKRGETVEYEPIEDILSRGMMGKDYSIRNAEMKAAQRALAQREAEIEAQAARTQAREQYLAEQEEMLRKANTDPEAYQSFQEHLRQMESNPIYRKRVEEALAAREDRAELETFREREHQAVVTEAAETVLTWIDDLAGDARFHGVDRERVRQIYSEALQREALPLDRRAVEHIFASEAEHLSKSLAPILEEVSALRAQVQSLSGAAGVERHNAQTAHALQRGKAPPTQPVGSPPAPAGQGPVKQHTTREQPEAIREWVNRR